MTEIVTGISAKGLTMDYARLADGDITTAQDRARDAGLSPAERSLIDALTGIGYALLHLAEVVGRLEQ